MFCTKCGTPVEPGQKFCNKCGTPVNAADVNVKGFDPQGQMQMQPQVQPKKKTWLIVLIILAVVMALSVVGGIMAYRAYHAVRNFMIDNDLADVPYIDSPDDYDTLDLYEDLSDGNLEDIEDLYEDYLDDITGDDGLEFDDTTKETIEYIFGDLDKSAVPYGYADVYVGEDVACIVPNGTVTDDTVIWNGKTLGSFCDYIDSDVFGGNRPMNRDLLYKLISIHAIDPLLIPDDATFETVMKYCLIVAAEFRDSGAVMNEGGFSTDDSNTYYYEMEVNGQTQVWMIDYDTHEVRLNDGKTEYTSAGEYGMFTEQSLAIWMYALSDYFGLE